MPAGGDVRLAHVNGEPGIVFRDGDRADLVLSFSFGDDGRVHRIYSQLNPEKLRHIV
jgi:hypothetical protein